MLLLTNKEEGSSKIALASFDGNKIADLALIEKGIIGDTNFEYFFTISNIEIIDIDNDGIMEILLEIPQSLGEYTISLLKYVNGELIGNTGVKGFTKTE